MKYLSLSIVIFILSTVVLFAQNNEKESLYDFFFRLLQSVEADRMTKQSEIKTYDDLVCTYWTPVYENFNSSQMDHGFIFLPNKTVLIVKTNSRNIYNPDNENEHMTINSIYSVRELCTYKIINERIIFDIGIPIAFLEQSYLFFTFDGNEYQKYRLEETFENSVENNYLYEVDTGAVD